MTQSLTDVIAEAMAHSRHAGGDFGMTGADAFRDRPNEFRKEATLFLQAIDQAGYVVTRKEPTDGMVQAAHRCIAGDTGDVSDVYRAMLSASKEG